MLCWKEDRGGTAMRIMVFLFLLMIGGILFSGCGGIPNNNEEIYDGSVGRVVRESQARYQNSYGKGGAAPVFQ